MKYEYVSDDCIAYHGSSGSVYLLPPYYNDWKYSVEVYVYNFERCSYDYTRIFFSDLPQARLYFELKVKELKNVL